jgi:D-arabinose 1-dehydrogenase-like Zn-dependent alcohol dehydrogenase
VHLTGHGQTIGGSDLARAAVMKAPGRLELERFPIPDPAPGAVLLKMSYSGI